MNKLKSAAELVQLRNNILSRRDPEKTIVSICGGTGCRAYKCMNVVKAFQNEIDRQQLNDKIELKLTGCHGFCERGSLMVIHPKKIFYQRVTPEDIPEIISETIISVFIAISATSSARKRQKSIPNFRPGTARSI